MEREWWYIVTFTHGNQFTTRILASALDLMRSELEEEENAAITIRSMFGTLKEVMDAS